VLKEKEKEKLFIDSYVLVTGGEIDILNNGFSHGSRRYSFGRM